MAGKSLPMWTPRWVGYLILGVLVAGTTGYLFDIAADKPTVGSEPISSWATRTVIQRYELKNRTNRLQRGVYFWVYGPVANTVANRLEKVVSNLEYRVHKDDFGNRIMAFHIDQIPPYSSVMVESKSHISILEGRMDDRNASLETFLSAEPLIESSDPRIMKLVRSFKQQKDKQRAEAIYRWVVEHIQPSDYQLRPLGAVKTLLARSGDCTEFAHLYTAIARAAGIPARVIAGYRYQGSALMRVDDQHNWAEVYLDGQWRIVDTHARQFLENEADYIATARLNRQSDGPLRGHQRYQVNNNSIRVRQY